MPSLETGTKSKTCSIISSMIPISKQLIANSW